MDNTIPVPLFIVDPPSVALEGSPFPVVGSIPDPIWVPALLIPVANVVDNFLVETWSFLVVVTVLFHN